MICAAVTREVADVTFSAEFVVGGKAFSLKKSEQIILFSRSLTVVSVLNVSAVRH